MRNRLRTYGLVGVAALLAPVGLACSSNDKVYRTESAVDIEATGQLRAEADRFTRLEAIAGRQTLRGGDQVLLIDKTLEAPLLPSQKADILVALVRNPSLHVTAKAHLLDRLTEGALPMVEQQTVLKAMIDHAVSRFDLAEDAPVGVISAVRQPPAITTAEPVTAPATPETSEPGEPEPITITPLPVK